MKTEMELDAETITLARLSKQYANEDKARRLFESWRWPQGVICPRCRNHKEKPIYKLKPKAESKSGVPKGVYKCGACREQFTAKVGTVLEGSHIPYHTWLMAMFILCSAKKSISAHQIHRMLGITYKTAWFLCHRIRYAMGSSNENVRKLAGTVEADETFVGGKGETITMSERKTPVVALIERGGEMRARVISNVTQKNIGKILNECVSRGAIVNTDEHVAYRNALKEYKRHDRVVHSRYEYSRPLPDGSKAGINTCESFFSLLKRGVHGSWHHVSREHLPRYATEFEFRWNTRNVSDGERFVKAIAKTEGKRLTYKQAV